MIKAASLIAFAISMVAISVQASYANGCTRHVVNETNGFFLVRLTDTRDGRDKDYQVPPFSTIEISYTGLPGFTTKGHEKWYQTVTIQYDIGATARNGRQQIIEYQDRGLKVYDVRAPDFGCDSYIQHQGNTGWVTVNEPANGDIIILE